jgi:hypothetical protein
MENVEMQVAGLKPCNLLIVAEKYNVLWVLNIARQGVFGTDQKLNNTNFSLAFTPCCGCLATFNSYAKYVECGVEARVAEHRTILAPALSYRVAPVLKVGLVNNLSNGQCLYIINSANI